MFIVLLNYRQPLEVVEQYLAEHRQYLEECYQQDNFLASGPRNPRTGGVIISQLTDRDKLQALLHNDPFHLHGIADYEIIEFDPVKKHKRLDL